MTSKAPKGRFFARVSANIRCPNLFVEFFVDAFGESDTLALYTFKKHAFGFLPVVFGNVLYHMFRDVLRASQLIFVFAAFARYLSAHLHIFTMKTLCFVTLCT